MQWCSGDDSERSQRYSKSNTHGDGESKAGYRNRAAGNLVGFNRHGDECRLGHSRCKTDCRGEDIYPEVVRPGEFQNGFGTRAQHKCGRSQLLRHHPSQRKQRHFEPLQKQRQAHQNKKQTEKYPGRVM